MLHRSFEGVGNSKTP